MFAVHGKRRIPWEGPVNEIKIFKPINLAKSRGASSAPHYVFLIKFFCLVQCQIWIGLNDYITMCKIMGKILWTAAPLLHAVLQHKSLALFLNELIVIISAQTLLL